MSSENNREWLLNLLSTYTLIWPDERANALLTTFIRRQPDCFERTCFDDGHVTGSAWVVCPQRRRVLLTHHRKLQKWLQLGGHSDGDANTLRVAQREAEEESGLRVKPINDAVFDIDIHTIPARGEDPKHKHYDVRFLFEADDHAPLTISSESNDLRWIAIEDLPNLTAEESVLRMARKSADL
ncbi:MAG: NUDIX hydrolase [Gammaproteobacteria bacterium]|nr:NUDIX hydrolase [Gammaproteobacteria bacterium]